MLVSHQPLFENNIAQNSQQRINIVGYNQIQYKQIAEGMPIILKEREVLEMVDRLQSAKSKEEINKIEERLRCIFTDQKNLTLLVNLVTSKDLDNKQKNILVSFFNFIVQQQIRKYEQIKRRNRCKEDFKVNDDFRRDAITLTSKIQKVIDSNHVDVNLKPNLVYLQLKIFNRSKEDWDVSRATNKMDFYLRKDNLQVAEAYFHNIIRLGYSTKQKVDVFRRAAQHLPKMGVKFLNKIQNFSCSEVEKNLSIYTDYKSNLSMFRQLLTLAFVECTDEIAITLSNSQMFITHLQMISQKIGHILVSLDFVNNQYAKEWSELVISILKQLSESIIHHKIKNNCYPFVRFFTNFVNTLFEQRYIVSSDTSKYEILFGDFLPLFLNATRLGQLPIPYLLMNDGHQQDSLSKASKYHILNTHIIALFSYFFQKINQFLQSNTVEKQNQFLEFFSEFCSEEEIDYGSDNFQYNFCLFFLVLVKKYGKVQFFVKNLIYCLLLNNKLFADLPAEQNEVQWWFMLDEIQITQSIGDEAKKMEIGMFLCLILYKQLQKDRVFVESCIKKFIEKVAIESYNPEKSIFQGSPQTITLFLLLFENWLEEISIFKNKNSRIQGFVFSPFINAIASQLCIPHPNTPGLPHLLLSFFLHYSQLIKQIISSYKRSPIFKNYSNSISFSQLSLPLQQLHRYESQIPVKYYCQLYQNIIEYEIFRLECEKIEQTVERAKVVLQKIIFYQIEQKEKEKYYFHEAFKVFQTLVNCEEYQVLFGDLFVWITETFNPKSLIQEYEQDIINICLIVLKKPSFLLGLNHQTLQKFWQLVYKLLQGYQWQNYNDQQKQLIPDVQAKNFASQQLQLIYLTSTFISFKQIKDVIMRICIKSLKLINSQVLAKKREMRIEKFRPYQLEEITFLLTLHKIIEMYHQDLTSQNIQEILNLYWKNHILRIQFPDDFNYVHGKYNLLIIMLLRYSYSKFTKVLFATGPQPSNNIFYEIFFNDKFYRVEYDSPWFVYHVTQIVSKLWSPSYNVKDCELILKYAHFAVGACIFVLDRIYQRHRFNKQQDLEVTSFSEELKDPTLVTDIATTKFINYLTNNQRQIDEFECFRNFYKRIKENKDVENWFNESMKLYIRSQTYLDYYYDVLSVKKIRRSDGLLIYRIYNKVNQNETEDNLQTWDT